jgi:hypothetical protein
MEETLVLFELVLGIPGEHWLKRPGPLYLPPQRSYLESLAVWDAEEMKGNMA